MNELKKLRDGMRGLYEVTPRMAEDWADTLDAYIQLQESAEPVACHEAKLQAIAHVCAFNFGQGHSYTPRTTDEDWQAHGWVIEAMKAATRQASPPPREPVEYVDYLHAAAPPPREPISREALESELGQAYEGEDCAWSLTEIFAALRALGIEVKP